MTHKLTNGAPRRKEGGDKRFSVVIVLHNSSRQLRDCLVAIPPQAELVIVDNASTDEWESVVADAAGSATIVRRLNDGFGAGCNAGAAVATTSVLVFLNPDTQVHPGSLERLTELASNRRCVAGPSFLTRDGATRFDCRKPSRWWQDAAELLPYARQWLPEFLRRDLNSLDPVYTNGGTLAYLQGACLAIPTEAFREVGGFDERFFLYCEEEDLCNRLGKCGLTCVYLPEAQVTHLGGTSTAGVALFARESRYRSTILFYAKRSRREGYVAAAAIFLALAVRDLEHSLRRSLRRQEWSSVDELRAIRSGLLQGLRLVSTTAN